ncbi:nucleotidyltransferase domain-containing protein [Sphingobacterium thalpophilum]|uniref:nucleotidyltransferase domain-containing protein n=1 Tax=Sphingobacterium thalpophilum TaxID=259 RepID=UPI002D78FB59|nr:nucleotidyltransferase family protein [Sphingobacterium thalpophilum]
MDKPLREILFQLLRIGLWQKGTLCLKKPLTKEDWSQILFYASKHTIEGIIYDSFNHLNEDQLPPQSLLLKWTVRIDQIERSNEQMNSVLSSQYKEFAAQDIHPLLMKGQGVAYFYNNPKHRICGDIDWYFENNTYDKARNFLKKREITINDKSGFSLDYYINGVSIEHHKDLFDISSPFKGRYLKNLQAAFRDKQQIIFINETPIKILAPELQLFQINAHILKHLLFFGVGLRQLCDSARLYAQTISDIDAHALKTIYKRSGILTWIHLLHILLVKYLGLPQSSLPFPLLEGKDADWMLEEIWHGGNFGYYDDRHSNGRVISAISSHPNGLKRLWNNLLRYLPYAPQEALFMQTTYLYSKWFGIDKD